MSELSVDGMALAPGVVETIVSIAANEVDGVASIGPSSSGLLSKIGGRSGTPGIEVGANEAGELLVSIHVEVCYGYVLPDVAANLRRAVADALSCQVGATIASIDVYVDGISFDR